MVHNTDVTADALRQIFRDMNAHQAQEIREAYYKAVEGLMILVETLEIADAPSTSMRWKRLMRCGRAGWGAVLNHVDPSIDCSGALFENIAGR